VDASPDLKADGVGLGGDRPGATYGTRGSVEGGEEPVADDLDLPPSEAFELMANGQVMGVEEVTPAPVPHADRSASGFHDIGAVASPLDHTPNTFIARTIGAVLRQHARQPETKLAAPDGTTCTRETRGLLGRREVHIDRDRVVYIGKEAGELFGYPNNVAADLDDRHTTYTADAGLDASELAALRDIGASALASRVDADRSTIHRILNGTTRRPGGALVQKLRREAELQRRRQSRRTE
jgi:hypothetical protein